MIGVLGETTMEDEMLTPSPSLHSRMSLEPIEERREDKLPSVGSSMFVVASIILITLLAFALMTTLFPVMGPTEGGEKGSNMEFICPVEFK